jgi:hypothetical protein
VSGQGSNRPPNTDWPSAESDDHDLPGMWVAQPGVSCSPQYHDFAPTVVDFQGNGSGTPIAPIVVDPAWNVQPPTGPAPVPGVTHAPPKPGGAY